MLSFDQDEMLDKVRQTSSSEYTVKKLSLEEKTHTHHHTHAQTHNRHAQTHTAHAQTQLFLPPMDVTNSRSYTTRRHYTTLRYTTHTHIHTSSFIP